MDETRLINEAFKVEKYGKRSIAVACTEGSIFEEVGKRVKRSMLGEYQNGVMYDEARHKCGGHAELTEALANGRVIKAGSGNAAMYFFKTVCVSLTQAYEQQESASSSSRVAEAFAKEYGAAVNEYQDTAGRFTRLPDSSSVSPESLMKALTNPGELTSLTIEDITQEIQTGANSGTVQCGVALDEPLARLAEHNKKLQRTIAIAEAHRKKSKDQIVGVKLTPP